MDVLKRTLVAEVEEDVGTKNGSNHCADTVESLGNVDSDLRVLRWAADWGRSCQWGWTERGRLTIIELDDIASHTCDERIGGSLQRAKTIADDEDGGTKSSKRLGLDAGDGDGSAYSVQEETPDEDGSVSIVTENPGCVSERGQWICAGQSQC